MAANPVLDATARRYAGAGRFGRNYVAGKLRHDPVHARVLELAASERFGTVVDLGCGRGQLGMALLQAGLADAVLGLDWNAAHLAQAERAAQGLAFRTARRDLARDPSVPLADTILMVDVLYQLDIKAQAALLQAAALAARTRLLVRTADPDCGIRSAMSGALERLGRRVWPHSGHHVNPLPVVAITATIQRAELRVEQAPCSQGTPFANVLLIARR